MKLASQQMLVCLLLLLPLLSLSPATGQLTWLPTRSSGMYRSQERLADLCAVQGRLFSHQLDPDSFSGNTYPNDTIEVFSLGSLSVSTWLQAVHWQLRGVPLERDTGIHTLRLLHLQSGITRILSVDVRPKACTGQFLSPCGAFTPRIDALFVFPSFPSPYTLSLADRLSLLQVSASHLSLSPSQARLSSPKREMAAGEHLILSQSPSDTPVPPTAPLVSLTLSCDTQLSLSLSPPRGATALLSLFSPALPWVRRRRQSGTPQLILPPQEVELINTETVDIPQSSTIATAPAVNTSSLTMPLPMLPSLMTSFTLMLSSLSSGLTPSVVTRSLPKAVMTSSLPVPKTPTPVSSAVPPLSSLTPSTDLQSPIHTPSFMTSLPPTAPISLSAIPTSHLSSSETFFQATPVLTPTPRVTSSEVLSSFIPSLLLTSSNITSMVAATPIISVTSLTPLPSEFSSVATSLVPTSSNATSLVPAPSNATSLVPTSSIATSLVPTSSNATSLVPTSSIATSLVSTSSIATSLVPTSSNATSFPPFPPTMTSSVSSSPEFSMAISTFLPTLELSTVTSSSFLGPIVTSGVVSTPVLPTMTSSVVSTSEIPTVMSLVSTPSIMTSSLLATPELSMVTSTLLATPELSMVTSTLLATPELSMVTSTLLATPEVSMVTSTLLTTPEVSMVTSTLLTTPELSMVTSTLLTTPELSMVTSTLLTTPELSMVTSTLLTTSTLSSVVTPQMTSSMSSLSHTSSVTFASISPSAVTSSASLTASPVPVNRPPVLSNPLPLLTPLPGVVTNFSIPPDTFSDPDQDLLSLQLLPLVGVVPDWLQLSGNQLIMLAPTESAGRAFYVQLSATDSANQQTADVISIIPETFTPPLHSIIIIITTNLSDVLSGGLSIQMNLTDRIEKGANTSIRLLSLSPGSTRIQFSFLSLETSRQCGTTRAIFSGVLHSNGSYTQEFASAFEPEYQLMEPGEMLGPCFLDSTTSPIPSLPSLSSPQSLIHLFLSSSLLFLLLAGGLLVACGVGICCCYRYRRHSLSPAERRAFHGRRPVVMETDRLLPHKSRRATVLPGDIDHIPEEEMWLLGSPLNEGPPPSLPRPPKARNPPPFHSLPSQI